MGSFLVKADSGTHPFSHVVGTWSAFSLHATYPECEADHSPPPNAKVMNVWTFISIPPCAFIGDVYGRDRCLHFTVRLY